MQGQLGGGGTPELEGLCSPLFSPILLPTHFLPASEAPSKVQFLLAEGSLRPPSGEG